MNKKEIQSEMPIIKNDDSVNKVTTVSNEKAMAVAKFNIEKTLQII